MTTRVLLVDDHALFRRGLRLLLEEEPDLEVVGEAEEGAAMIDQVRELTPDLVVMDIAMRSIDGIEATREILRDVPGLQVVALSAQAGQHVVRETLRAGARGYVLKESAPEDLVLALRTVARGEVYLSPAIASVVVSDLVDGAPSSQPEKAADHEQLVLRTKLHSPALSPDLILRSRLVERWEELIARPLTVVSSPAGYGKSTLASQWLQAWDGPHAWVSLDDEDNDPRAFVAGFIASIRIPFPEACAETWSLLGAAQLPPTTTLARRILNDLDAIAESFVLVLDDYHRIRSRDVHDLLAEMLSHPLRRVHMVLLTRRDPPLPIPSLRGRGQVNELGVSDMRFSVEETTLFLESHVEFPIDVVTARAIHAKLEGWPAGVRLVAQSLASRTALDHVLAGLEGGFASIVDYLMDEVLSRLSPELADLMVATSVLERFCAPLCRALRDPRSTDGDEESDGREFLARLGRENLFLVALDPEGRWFRFHHLFQDLLRMQLTRRRSADEIAALHSRASAWFAENGHIDEGIQHALSAGDVDGATRLVEANRQALLEEDRWFVLEKWLSAFPKELVWQRPALLLTYIWVLDYRFDHQELAAALDKADALVGKSDPLRAEVEFFRGYLDYFEGDVARSIEHLHSALERIPTDHHEFRAQADMVLGMARQMAGQEGPALEHLNELLSRVLDLREGTRTRLQASIVLVHLLEGRLPEAGVANHDMRQYSTRGGYRHAEAWGSYLQGLIHFWRSELGEAIDCFDDVVRAKYIIEKRAVVDSMTGLALAQQGMGRSDCADAAVKDLLEYVDALHDPAYSLIARSSRTRLSILRGETAAATEMMRGQLFPTENMFWWLEIPSVTHCRALLAVGSDENVRAARERLEELLRSSRDDHNALQAIGILSLLALARDAEHFDDGVALARRAAGLAGPGGAWHPLVEAGPRMVELLRCALEEDPDAPYVSQALSAITAATGAEPSTLPPGMEPLTEREVEILRLVAEGLSNKEIAARIYRSIETVKKHLYHAYKKLGADGRIAALTRARELGVLPRDGGN